MSSALQSELTALQQNNYVTLAILIAVGYDYVLTFSNEIEYFWTKPWTWVSTLFVLVRYCGLYQIVVSALLGSSFLPGPAETYVFLLPSLSGLYDCIRCLSNSCKMMVVIRGWVFLLFLGAADFTMILRVWAMYSRSRLILVTLLALFSLEITAFVVVAAVQSDPQNLSAHTIQILDFSFCMVDPTSFMWVKVNSVIQMMNGAAVCILAIAQFVKQSLQMYRVTRRWELNRYMGLLVKQGIFYFLAVFMFFLINILASLGTLSIKQLWQADLTFLLQYVPMATLTPRFIIGIRELHARDVQGRRGEGIDTGFGFPSRGGGVGGTMMFAGLGLDGGLEGAEEIPLEFGTTELE
ncbi:hypothetical protein HD554DRAFT_2272914 [Boletus coccyginus]|nr:hypothetical protein HD554DRAFT_2272914 [Boletus coccyginus]